MTKFIHWTIFSHSRTKILASRWEKFKRLRSSGRTLPGRAGGKRPSGITGFPRPARPRWVPAPSRYVAALNFSHLHHPFLSFGLAGGMGWGTPFLSAVILSEAKDLVVVTGSFVAPLGLLRTPGGSPMTGPARPNKWNR